MQEPSQTSASPPPNSTPAPASAAQDGAATAPLATAHAVYTRGPARPQPSVLWAKKRHPAGKLGRNVTLADVDILLRGDTDVYKPNGQRLLMLRRNAISQQAIDRARPVLQAATARGTMAGRGHASGAPMVRVVKQDGTLSNTSRAQLIIKSNLLGYYDRYPRFPYCRETAYTIELAQRMPELHDFLHETQECFAKNVPERYAAQMAMVKKTHPDFVLRAGKELTPWTTLTVNHNFQTFMHVDSGDLEEGFSDRKSVV